MTRTADWELSINIYNDRDENSKNIGMLRVH